MRSSHCDALSDKAENEQHFRIGTLAEKVTSPSELRALERRRQAAEDAVASAGDEAEYERAVARSELLEEASELAMGKVLRWQYLPQLDLDTPSSTIQMAFKVFDAQSMKELRRTVGGGEGDWHGLDGYAEREDEPEYLKGLLRYRAIVESSVGVEEKASKIQSLLREESALAREFFEEEGEGWTYADQYLIGELRSVGVPKVDQFYSRGFRTAEAIAALDTSVVRGWKGVGPKTAQAFEEWKQGRKSSG